jgi:YgiT-type zinc finger domain-containing protein
MKCVICKFSQTEEGKVTVALHRGETVLIIKDVPANICKNCGEYYLDEIVTNRVFAQAEEAVNRHAELEILRYAA